MISRTENFFAMPVIYVYDYHRIFMAKANDQNKTNGSALDFEAQPWATADKMRGHMDASEYKHVCRSCCRASCASRAVTDKLE